MVTEVGPDKLVSTSTQMLASKILVQCQGSTLGIGITLPVFTTMEPSEFTLMECWMRAPLEEQPKAMALFDMDF